MQDIKQTIQGLRISIMEGAMAHIFANLTGSIFLPAFALLLGANAFQIGLLASVQFFATLSQLPGSVLVERLAHRKRIAVLFASFARLLWVPLIVFGVVTNLSAQKSGLLYLLIAVVVGYHLMAAVSGVSWLSWMSGLVPEEIRGRFFGLRNSVLGIMTILVTIGGGTFLDLFPDILPGISQIYAFYIIFGLAVAAGMFSVVLLSRQPELYRPEPMTGKYFSFFFEPLKNTNFRRLIIFAIFWSFAVNFAAPFYVVYMIKDLKLSYTIISTLTVTSAIADLVGMGVWGHFSDQVGNRAIMILSAAMAAILPFLWIFTSPSVLSVFIFIPFLHLLGGFVVSGYNLTSVNLIFRTVPKERNSVYFALWTGSNGVMAGFGALAGGIAASTIELPLQVLDFEISFSSIFKVIFLISSCMRVFALVFLLKVREEKGEPIMRVVRVLRNVRSWASMMGYHPVLQFFLPARNENVKNSPYWPIWKRDKK